MVFEQLELLRKVPLPDISVGTNMANKQHFYILRI